MTNEEIQQGDNIQQTNEPIYKTKSGQIVTQSQLISSKYTQDIIDRGVKDKALTLIGDTKYPDQEYKTSDNQIVSTKDLLASKYTQDVIDRGVHEGALIPIEKKNPLQNTSKGLQDGGSKSTIPTAKSIGEQFPALTEKIIMNKPGGDMLTGQQRFQKEATIKSAEIASKKIISGDQENQRIKKANALKAAAQAPSAKPKIDYLDFAKQDIINNGGGKSLQTMPSDINSLNKYFDNNAYNATDYFSNRIKDVENQIKDVRTQNMTLANQREEYKKGDIGMGVQRPLTIDGKPLPQTSSKEIESNYDKINRLTEYRNNLKAAADKVASVYTATMYPEASLEEKGKIKRKFSGDPSLEEQDMYERLNIPLTDEQKLQNGYAGIDVERERLDNEYSNMPKDDSYYKRMADINDSEKALISKFPEYKKDQIGLMVAQLASDDPKLRGLVRYGIGNIDKDMVDYLSTKYDIPKSDLSGLEYGDIPANSSVVGSLAKGVYNVGAGIVSGANRIVGSALGVDPERLTYVNKGISESGNKIFGFNPSQSIEEAPTVLDTNPNSPTYLRQIQNKKAGKYNYNLASVSNALAEGIGGFAGFIGGLRGISAAGKGLGMLAEGAAGEDAAMTSYMVISGYENNYQDADRVLGKDASEASKALFAVTKGYIDALAFKVLPKDKLFGKSAVQEAAEKELATSLAGIDIKNINRNLLESKVKKVVGGILRTAEETGHITGAMSIADASKAIVNAVLGKEGKEGEYLAEGVQAIKSTLVQTPLSMTLPLGIMEAIKYKGHSSLFKENLYSSGLKPDEYRATIQQELAKGNITEQDAKARLEVVDTMSHVVQSIPDVNPKTNARLTHAQQVDYAYNRLKEIAAKAKSEDVKDDEALSSLYKGEAKKYADERKTLLEQQAQELVDQRKGEVKIGKLEDVPELKATIDNLNEEIKLGGDKGAKAQVDLEQIQKDPVAYYEKLRDEYKASTEGLPEAETKQTIDGYNALIEKIKSIGEAKVETTEIKPVEVKEGDTIELPAQVEGGLPRKMIFKEGEWKQQVGDNFTDVGEVVKQQAQTEFDKTNQPEGVVTPVVEVPKPKTKVQKVGEGLLTHLGITPEQKEAVPAKTYTAENVDTISTKGLNKVKTKVINDVKNVVKSISTLVGKTTGKVLEVSVHESPETYEKAVIEAGGTKQDSTTKGFYLDSKGTIHLNMEKATTETMLHEGFHPVLDYIADNRPEVVDTIYDQLNSFSEGKRFVESNKRRYTGETTQKKEAITDFIANVADGSIVINPSNYEAVKKFVIDSLNKLGFDIKSFETIDIKNADELVNLAKNISEKFKKGEEIKGEELLSKIKPDQKFQPIENKGDVGDIAAAGKIDESKISNAKVMDKNPLQFSREEFKETELNKLPVKSLKEVLDPFGNRAIAINSDPTKVGKLKLLSGEEIFMYGGLNYSAIKANVEGEIGFSSSDLSKPKQIQGVINKIFPDNNGEGLILTTSQSPESMKGNAYSLEYVLDALKLLPKSVLKSSEFKSEFFGKDIVAIKDAFGEKKYNEFLSKYGRADFSNEQVMREMTSDLLNNVGGNFVARNSLVSNMLAGVTKKSTRKATEGEPGYISVAPNKFISKQLLDRFDLNQEKLFYEIGEKGIVDVFMNKGEWGFVTGGFTSDSKVDYMSIQDKGIVHPQFNAKFHGKDPFILDGGYQIDKLFLPEEIIAQSGKPYTKKASLMVAGSMYPKGEVVPTAEKTAERLPQFSREEEELKQKPISSQYETVQPETKRTTGEVKINSEKVQYNGTDAIGSRERSESEQNASRNAAKEKIKNPETNASLKAANSYNKSVGLPEVTPHKYKPSDPVLQTELAKVYPKLQDVNSPTYKETNVERRIYSEYKGQHPEIFKQYDIKDYKDLVHKSYDQLIKETELQYDALPVKVTFHEKGEGNYKNNFEMLDDVHNFNHLWVYKGGADHTELGSKTADKDGVTANDKFRAVHDYYGHSVEGYQFGKDGEENAWIEHSKMFSPLAQWALSSETRGQNSFVNYSGVNDVVLQTIKTASALKKEGEKTGNKEMVNEADMLLDTVYDDFQFAEQKAIILPPKFADVSKFHTTKISEVPTKLQEANKPQFSKEGKIEWEESRIGRGDRAITERNENVKNAAEDLYQGKIDSDEYTAIVDKNSPTRVVTNFIEPAKEDDIKIAVGTKSEGKVNLDFPEGKKVGVRLDIPSYINKNIWAITVHEQGRTGSPLSYNNVAKLRNVEFITDPSVALDIARHKELSSGGRMGKATIARMMGEWIPIEGDTGEAKGKSAMKMVEEIKDSPEWVQIGMNPFRFSHFYDRATGTPIVKAEEIIQIGGLVYGKNVETTSKNDPRFTVKDKNGNPIIGKGGKPIQFQKEEKIEGTLDGKPTTFVKHPEDLKIVNGFYSPIEKRLLETKAGNLSANKWKDVVGKGDEAKFTGVLGWLESLPPTQQLKKSEVQNWMKENRIEISEVVLPEHKMVKGRAPISLELPGEKSNYKEVLITLPNLRTTSKFTDGEIKAINEYNKLYDEKEDFSKKIGLGTPTEAEKIEFGRIFSKMLEAKKKLPKEIASSTFYKVDIRGKAKEFSSSHYDEPNILAHIRMNTRVDAEGNKVLHIEEFQSDWGQTGKKEGFKKEFNANRYQELQKKILQGIGKMKKEGKIAEDEMAVPYEEILTKPEVTELKELEQAKATLDKKIPEAPFVTETANWAKLAWKVALKEAVKEGADKITWTTGEQQNERYNLSKSVDEIGWQKNEDATYTIIPKKSNEVIGQRENMSKITLNRVADLVGKDIAEKIKNEEGKEWQGGNVVQGNLKGEQLTIGGTGMIGFYGSPKEGKIGIVGEVAKSLFKQVPSTTEINGEQQNSIDITPEMKAQVEAGLPQFSKGKDQESQIKEYIDNQRKEGVSEEDIRAGIESVSDKLGLDAKKIDSLMEGEVKPEVPTAKAEPTPQPEGKTASIKNAASRQTRIGLNLPDVTLPKIGTDVEALNEGKRLVDEGEIDTDDVILKVLYGKGKIGMSPDESKAMLYHMTQLKAAETDVRRQIADTENIEDKAVLSGKLQQISDAMDAATEANMLSGTAWSDVGRVRQLKVDESFNVSREKAVIKDAYGGTIPEEVQAKIEKIISERDEAINERNKIEKALRSKMAKESFEAMMKRANKLKNPAKEVLLNEEKDLLAKLKIAFKKDLNNLNAGIPIPKETMEVIGKLAVNYIKQGMVTLDAIVNKIHDQIKGDVPQLSKDDIKDIIGNYRDFEREKETSLLEKKAGRLEKKLAEPEKILPPKREPLVFRKNTEWVRANQKVANAEFKMKVEKRKALESQKNMYQKGLMWAGRAVRLSVLSGYKVLGKLASAAVVGGAGKRLPEQAIGQMWAHVFRGVSEKAPIEGFSNAKAEAKFYKEFFDPKKFAQNSWSILSTGESKLNKRMGAGEYEHIPFLYLPTDLHQIIKDPLKRAAFESSFLNGLTWAEKNGLDINDDLVIQSLENAAYKRANYEIFQEQNSFSRWFAQKKNQLERSGNAGATGKLLVDIMIPVSTVPTNIVRRVFSYSPIGLIKGGVEVTNAYRKGIENLSNEQADKVMRQLKQGSLGTALWLIGWFGASYFGGLYSKYNPNKKRLEGELASDEMEINGVMTPKPVQHALPLEVIQVAATTRHIYDNYTKNKDANDVEALTVAAMGSIGATIEQVPVLETGVNVALAFKEPYYQAKLGEDIGRRFKPQILRETGIIGEDKKELTKQRKQGKAGKKRKK